jgi:hypothetical protein
MLEDDGPGAWEDADDRGAGRHGADGEAHYKEIASLRRGMVPPIRLDEPG